MEELKKWLQEEDVKNTSDTTNPLKDDEYHISQSWSQRKESITKEWTLLREKILNHFISFQVNHFFLNFTNNKNQILFYRLLLLLIFAIHVAKN